MRVFSAQYKLPIINSHGMFFDAQSFHVLDVKDDSIEPFLLALLNGEEVRIPVEKPVKYEPTKIVDAYGTEIISIRGWGRLQKLKDGDKIQDEIGKEIAELINKSMTP